VGLVRKNLRDKSNLVKSEGRLIKIRDNFHPSNRKEDEEPWLPEGCLMEASVGPF
jgi:hypothetical protein